MYADVRTCACTCGRAHARSSGSTCVCKIMQVHACMSRPVCVTLHVMPCLCHLTRRGNPHQNSPGQGTERNDFHFLDRWQQVVVMVAAGCGHGGHGDSRLWSWLSWWQ